MPTHEIRSEHGPEVTDLPESATVCPKRRPSEYMRPHLTPWTEAEHAYVAEQNEVSP